MAKRPKRWIVVRFRESRGMWEVDYRDRHGKRSSMASVPSSTSTGAEPSPVTVAEDSISSSTPAWPGSATSHGRSSRRSSRGRSVLA